MIRGFVTGVIWGGVVAATGLAVVSQVAPLPGSERVSAGSDGPVVTVLPEAPAAVDPAQGMAQGMAQGTEQVPVEPDPAAPAATLPQADVAVVAPEAEPVEALQPEILQKGPEPEVVEPEIVEPEVVEPQVVEPEAAGGVAGADAGETGDGGATASAPVAAAPVADASPDMGVASDALVAERMLAQPGLVPDAGPDAPDLPSLPDMGIEVPGALAEPAPGLAGADMPAAPGADIAPAATAPPPPPRMEEALLQPGPDQATPPVPSMIVPDDPLPTLPEATLPEADVANETVLAVPNVTTDRLPRIGDDLVPEAAGPESEGPESEGMEQAGVVPEVVLGTTPLELFRRDFDNPDAKPLFGIILIDEGIPQEERARLAALPFAVTFALDPLATDAADAARIYRMAGQEVVMLASGIPQGATAGDLEQTFQALDMAMPEAVAVLDRREGGFQDTLELARQAVPIVAEQGRGIITYDGGLNSADQVARREGVPRATIFRVLDGEEESIPKMRNYLDRAAFKAAQEGRVLVIGRARAETLAAILEWTVEGRAASVALAPVSALLETSPNP